MKVGVGVIHARLPQILINVGDWARFVPRSARWVTKPRPEWVD